MSFLEKQGAPSIPKTHDKPTLQRIAPAYLTWYSDRQDKRELLAGYESFLQIWSPVYEQ